MSSDDDIYYEIFGEYPISYNKDSDPSIDEIVNAVVGDNNDLEKIVDNIAEACRCFQQWKQRREL